MALENGVESWTRFHERSTPTGLVGRPMAGKTEGSGLLRLKADLPPEIAETIDSFERYSFRLTYAIIGFAGAALVLIFLIAWCLILVTGK